MKRRIANTIFPVFLLALSYNAHGQCTCMGGAAVGGSMPAGVEGAIGVLHQEQFRTSVQYRYGSGDTHFRGDSKAEAGPVLAYRMQYLGILAGYGLTSDITVETEVGYFLEKHQDFGDYIVSGSGPSHISLSGKYNVFSNTDGDFEATIGAGGWAPFEIGDKNLPQHVLPSTGAYGAFIQALLQKTLIDDDLRFVLTHRSDFSAENRLGYTYGPGFFTSLYSIWDASDQVTALLQIRSEVRLQDKYKGSILEDSGSNVFIVSPQFAYSLGEFHVAALIDIPLYRYYTGHQLANDGSLAISVSWQTQLFGE